MAATESANSGKTAQQTKILRKPAQITFEDARKFATLLAHGKTQAEIAASQHTKQSVVSRAVQIFDLPKEAIDWCESKGLSVFAGYALVRLHRKSPDVLQEYIKQNGEGLAFVNGMPRSSYNIQNTVKELLNPTKAKQVRARATTTYTPDPAKATERLEQERALAQTVEELIHAFTGRLVIPAGMTIEMIELLCRGMGLEKDFTYPRAMEQAIRNKAKHWQKGATGIDPVRVFESVFKASSYQHKVTTEGGARWVRLAYNTVQVCGECGEAKSMSSIYCRIPQGLDGEPETPVYRCGEHLGVDKAFDAPKRQEIAIPPGHHVLYGDKASGKYHFVKDGERASRCGRDEDDLIVLPKAGMVYEMCIICKQQTAGAVKHG